MNQANPLNPDLQQFLATKDAKALGDFIHEAYKKAKNDRSRIQRQWYLNMSFYYGKHFVTFVKSSNSGGLRTPSAPPWRTRMAVNRVRSIIRTEKAKLTSQKPNASVVPASSDDQDLMAAQAGEQVWESLYHRKQVHKEFGRMIFWLQMCGTSFMKDYWNPDGADQFNPDMAGDIEIEHVTPFHLFVPDLREIEIESQPYVLNVYTKPVEWVRTWLGPNAPKNLEPNVNSVNEILEDGYLDLGGASRPDSVLVTEAWFKPQAHKLMPEGGRLVLVGNEIVDGSMDGLPYDHGEYPFTKFDHIDTGKFYAESSITDLIPLQREYNRTRGQIIDAKNRMAKPQLLAQKGSIDPSKITSQPGQVILYKPGYQPPTPLPLQPLPSYVLDELQRNLMDMDDISGQHEVSQGRTPPGVVAATAISYLQEQDDNKLSSTFTSIEVGYEKLARHTLSHVVQYWSVPRMVKVVGADGSFDAMMLKGANLKNGTDIRMEAGSSLPTSKAAKQALIMDFMKFGWIPPQEGLKLMEIGGAQKLYENLRIDERQAQRENLRMKSATPELIEEHVASFIQAQQMGAPTTMSNPEDDPSGMGMAEPLQPPPLVPVNTWDNHIIHIEVHNRYRKSQDFELLPQEVKDLFEHHVMMHVAALEPSMPPPGMEPGGPPPGDNGGANQFAPGGEPGMGEQLGAMM